MKRYALIALLAVLVALTFTPTLAASSASTEGKRVILVLVPNLRWQDITDTATPTLSRLVQTSAIGDINARSRTRLEGAEGSPLEGPLTISAGAWASPVPGAPAAYSADEPYEGGTAAEAYRRTTGVGMGDNAIAFLGMPMTQRYNDELSFEVELGTLGGAIVDAGGATAAVGNSDAGYATDPTRQLVRLAALAAMDKEGRVNYGDVSPRMLRSDPTAPYGIATDADAVSGVLESIDRRLRRTGQNALIVLDPGDPYRAIAFAPYVSDGVATLHRQHALASLDEIVGIALGSLPQNGTLILASQAAGQPQNAVEGLGPVIIHGPGWSGYLTSPSTHRAGIVTNLDVTATVLDLLDVERPVNVIGNPMTSVSGGISDRGGVEHLERLAVTAESVDAAKVAIINGFIIVIMAVVVVSTLVLLGARHWALSAVTRWVWVLERLLLLMLAVPPASWLMFAFVRWPSSSQEATAVFLAVTLALWLVTLVIQQFTECRVPVAFLSLATAGIILVDQWFGAPLSFTSYFGYSPLLGARFYGLGNEASAALVGATIVGLAFLFDEWPDSPWVKWGRNWGVLLAGLLVVATAAAPFLGANVGVVAWGVVGFGLAWAQMNHRKLSWRLVVAAVAVIALLLAVFSAIDLSGEGEQTHLGRALSSAGAGGLGELGIIIARKAQTNLRVLTHTNWAYVLIAILAFLGFMRWRPQGDFAETLTENPHFSSAMSACLVAGLAAFFTEDSGIVIPAIMLIYVGVGTLYLMLSRLPRAISSHEQDQVAA